MAKTFRATDAAIARFGRRLDRTGVKFLRFELPDLHGISRCKVVPTQNVENYCKRGLNFYGGAIALDTASHVVSGTLYNEEVKYRDQTLYPDFDTLAPVPWHDATAKVICDTEWDAGKPLLAAPRYVLAKAVAEAERMGYRVLMAHEFEFYVLDRATLKPLFTGLHIFNNVRNQWAPFIDDLLNHLMTMGVDVITHNCEYAGAQYEINYKADWGVAGADRGFTFKNAVKEFVHRAGYLATFMAKPWIDSAGSGCHVHVSLWDKKSGKNVMLDAKDGLGISDVCKAFVQGLVDHGRALMPIMNPTPNCYHRIRPHTFAPSNISWGVEDRSAMVRVKSTGDDGTHVENRLGSAMGNPYLTAAATLQAGLLGIKAKSKLKGQSAGTAEEDPNWPRLPQRLPEALDALAADKAMREALGEEFFQVFNAMKRYELSRFHGHVTDWERTEYLEVH